MACTDGTQQQKLKLPPCNSNAATFYECSDLSDCQVVIDADGRVIPCHKITLSAASAVFRAMFVSSDMLEAKSGKVVVKDATPEVVDMLLRHMYGLEVLVPVQQVAALYQLADQYQVQSALLQLQAVIKGTSLTVDDLMLLMPDVAALGDTAAELQALLAHQAAKLIDNVLKHSDRIKGWSLLEVELVMKDISRYPASSLQLAAAWIGGDFERMQNWDQLHAYVRFEHLPYCQLSCLQQQQGVLAVPGIASALFKECLRRIDKVAVNCLGGRTDWFYYMLVHELVHKLPMACFVGCSVQRLGACVSFANSTVENACATNGQHAAACLEFCRQGASRTAHMRCVACIKYFVASSSGGSAPVVTSRVSTAVCCC